MGETEATFDETSPAPTVWSMLESLTVALEGVSADTVVENGLACLGNFAAARQGSVYVPDDSRALRLAGKKGPRELPAEVYPDERTSLMLKAMRGGSSLFIRDVDEFREGAGVSRDYSRSDSEDGKCILLPLGSKREGETKGEGNRITGVLNLTSLEGEIPDAGSERAHALVHGAQLLGVALRATREREDLESRASLDSLTDLSNYASFYDSLGREVFRSERYGLPLSLILIDIDHFKAINDRYGHLAGDEILIAVARRIRAALRGSDLPARYGGDEFAVTLPQTNTEGALRVAKRILEQVTRKSFVYLRTPISVTASLGIAEFQDGMTAVDLVGKADGSLYAAKDEGRNRVVGAH